MNHPIHMNHAQENTIHAGAGVGTDTADQLHEVMVKMSLQDRFDYASGFVAALSGFLAAALGAPNAKALLSQCADSVESIKE